MLMLASLLCGLVFGAGLLISGMVQPTKVLAFLDIFGAWDPSLIVVMIAALAVSAPGFVLARRSRPVLCGGMCVADQNGARSSAGRLDPRCSASAGASLACARARRWKASRHCRLTCWCLSSAMTAGMILHDVWQKARPKLRRDAALADG